VHGELRMPSVARARQRPTARVYGVVAGLAGSVTVGYGVLSYAFAVVLVPMADDLGWSQAVLTGAFSVALGVAALAGIPIGMALDRGSPLRVLVPGALLAVATTVAWSRVGSIVGLYGTFALSGVAMAAILYPATLTVATKWLGPWRHGGVTAITVVGSSASLLFSPLTAHLVGELGWRSAVLVLAGVLAATVPVLVVALWRPPAVPREALADAPDAPGDEGAPVRTPGFWLLTAAFAIGALAWSTMTIHLVALLVDRGRTVAFAGTVAGAMGISQLPGRLVLGLVVRRVSSRAALLTAYGTSAVGLVVLGASASAGAAVGFAVVYGLAAGMLTILGATVPADLFGRARFGTAYGVMSAFATGARALAPIAGSAVVLSGLGYDVLIWTLVGLTALAALLGAAGLRAVTQPS
jgi:MFS family permease